MSDSAEVQIQLSRIRTPKPNDFYHTDYPNATDLETRLGLDLRKEVGKLCF